MAELDYAGLLTGLENQLKADAALDGVTVTQEPMNPTTEECPAVLLQLRRASRRPQRIVGGLLAGAPDDVTALIEVQCWTFSGQGAADAGRQRDDLLRNVIDAVRRDSSIGSRVLWSQATVVDFQTAPGGSGGSVYAVAVLTVEAYAQC